MRIAYICADGGIPLYGSKGASNHVREFVQALTGLGHQVTVLAARLGTPAADLGCDVHSVVPREEEPFPVAIHPEIAGVMRNEALMGALDDLHRAQPLDLVYERYSLWSYAGLEFAAARDLPFILEVNSPLRLEQKKYRALHMDSLARLIERSLFGSATLLAGVSAKIVEYAVAQSGRTLPALVLPNGVDLDLFESVAPPPDDAPFTVGFVGSLKPWHGVELLVEAFHSIAAESPESQLLIVGEGPLRSWIEEYAQTHGLGRRIHAVGAAPKSRVPKLLAEMHVAVAPYPEMEDFYFSPLKLFEYMAAGCAVVASNIGQLSDILRDEETALLAAPGSARDLADKVGRLRDNVTLRRSLGAAARREAFQRHGWPDRVRTLFDALPAGRAVYA